jgi:hypothetical protein
MISCKNGHKYKGSYNSYRIDSTLSVLVGSDVFPTVQAVVIIPRGGCGGCIEEATTHMAANYNHYKNTVIVFTEIQDLKLLRIQVGNLLKQKNVYLDKSNSLGKFLNSFYPEIYFTKNGETYRTIDFSEWDKEFQALATTKIQH